MKTNPLQHAIITERTRLSRLAEQAVKSGDLTQAKSVLVQATAFELQASSGDINQQLAILDNHIHNLKETAAYSGSWNDGAGSYEQFAAGIRFALQVA